MVVKVSLEKSKSILKRASHVSGIGMRKQTPLSRPFLKERASKIKGCGARPNTPQSLTEGASYRQANRYFFSRRG
jgi:hypothetical protein